MIYELLIRGTAEGTISGSHAIDFVDGRPGLPRPIKASDWPAIASEINAALIATVAELQGTLAERDTALSSLTDAILTVKSAPDIDTAKTIAREATRNETEKKRAALLAEIAAKQEELDRLI